MLKLWGRTNSLNVQKVLFCLGELGLPFERVDAGMQFGVVKSPEYMAKNPNSVVPTLEDDGFVLWESNAIVRYLAATHGAGTLWPTDPRARAQADRWMDWQQTSHNPALTRVFWNLIRQPGSVPEAEFADVSAKVERAMDILEEALARSTWLGGEAFTMAECALAPGVHRYLHLPMERKSRPHLARWYEAVLQRPVAQQILLLPLT